MKFNTADEAFAHLESFTNLEKAPNLTAREYRLDRMFELCELFGNPQNSFKSIHVAGSKGKGSTAAFIAAALSANGLKTGLYCSPHVETYKERISEAGSFFNDRIYAETASNMMCVIEREIAADVLPGGPPTTFELLTLLAFLIFRETGCEWAVFETGLGGRLDATNVIVPEASVLTIIELEHTEYLGDTITKIAGEKAGIIKPGVPVFSAQQSTEAEEVFRKRAYEKDAEIFFPDELIKSILPIHHEDRFSQACRIVFQDDSAFNILLRSAGSFQIKNAALAVSVLKHLMTESFDPSAGIAETALPGRMELFITHGGIRVMLDGAHTVESVNAVANAFRSLNEVDSVLLFGAVEGKNVAGMAEKLGSFNHIIISTPGSFKKSSPDDVYRIFSKLQPESDVCLEKKPEEALQKALSYKKPVLVTGSFYMVAEIRKLL